MKKDETWQSPRKKYLTSHEADTKKPVFRPAFLCQDYVRLSYAGNDRKAVVSILDRLTVPNRLPLFRMIHIPEHICIQPIN